MTFGLQFPKIPTPNWAAWLIHVYYSTELKKVVLNWLKRFDEIQTLAKTNQIQSFPVDKKNSLKACSCRNLRYFIWNLNFTFFVWKLGLLSIFHFSCFGTHCVAHETCTCIFHRNLLNFACASHVMNWFQKKNR